MPQFAPLTLADGQLTPVNKTFSVGSLVEGLGSYFERTAGRITAQPTVSLKVSTSNKSAGINRIPLKIAVPYVDPVTGVVSTARFNGEFIVPNTVPSTIRDDIYGFAKSLLANTVVADAVKKVEGLY